MITRRHFVAATAALLSTPKFALASPSIQLRAEPVKLDLLPNKNPTSLLGFNGSTPGPTIRAKQGEKLNIRFENRLSEGSSIHWHGIRLHNAMDGVPMLTQNLVNPNKDFNYSFTPPDAGTYWYHSHNRSWEQVARGLYGALIVEEKKPPLVDHDIIIYLDDWRLNRDGSQASGFENMHDQAHEGRLGNFVKAIFQGVSTPIKHNHRVRMRFINVATDRIFPLQLSGISGKVVAYDGMPLDAPEPIDNLVIAPAQRVDIIADVIGREITVDFPTRDGLFRLGSLPSKGEASAKTKAEIITLETNNYKLPDQANATQLTLKMKGGAMSLQMMMGMMSGKIWAFNGVSGMPDKPFHQFQSGETAIIDLVNETRFPHAIHLHGHHFQALDPRGLSALRDTILVEAEQSKKIACVFDNPGKWLLHCHMLSHQAAGMKTWVEVS